MLGLGIWGRGRSYAAWAVASSLALLAVAACALPSAGTGNNGFAAPRAAPAQDVKPHVGFTLKVVQDFLAPTGSTQDKRPLSGSTGAPSVPLPIC